MGRLMSTMRINNNNNAHISDRTYSYEFPTSVSNNFNDNYYFCGYKCKRNNDEKLFFEDDQLLKKIEPFIRPLSFPVSFATKNVKPVYLMMFATRNSFTVTKCQDSNVLMLQFVFDSDCDCLIDVYLCATEKFSDSKLNYLLNPTMGMKYSSVRSRGANQLFKCELEDTKIDGTVPVTVVLSPAHLDPNVGFQQFVTNLSFATRSQLEQVSSTQVSLQKLIYGDNCYLIQELYGADLTPDREVKESPRSAAGSPDDIKGEDILEITKDKTEHTMQDCVVCMTTVRDTLVLPCRHLCVCSTCGQKLLHQSPACPICRSTFRALIQFGNLETYLCHSK